MQTVISRQTRFPVVSQQSCRGAQIYTFCILVCDRQPGNQDTRRDFYTVVLSGFIRSSGTLYWRPECFWGCEVVEDRAAKDIYSTCLYHRTLGFHVFSNKFNANLEERRLIFTKSSKYALSCALLYVIVVCCSVPSDFLLQVSVLCGPPQIDHSDMAPEIFEERNIAKRGALFQKVENWETQLQKCEQESTTIGNEMAQLRTRLESLLTQIVSTRVELDSNIRPHQCRGTDSTLATKPFPDPMSSLNGKDQLSEYVTATGSTTLRCESRGSLTCEADEDTAEACCRIEEECLVEMAFCSSVDNVPPTGHPVEKTCSRSSGLFEADINLILDSLLTCSDQEEAQSFDEAEDASNSDDDLSCVDVDDDDDESVSNLEMTAEVSDVRRDPTSRTTQSTHDICVTRVGDEKDKDQYSPVVPTMSEIKGRVTSEDAHSLSEKEDGDGFVFEEDLLSIISEVSSCISGEVQAAEKDVCQISKSEKSVIVCGVWGDSDSNVVFGVDTESVKDEKARLETRKEYITREDSITGCEKTEMKRKGNGDEMTAEMRGQDKEEAKSVIPFITSRTTDREHNSAESESDDNREASELVVTEDDILDTALSIDGDSSASTHPMDIDGEDLNDTFGSVTVCRTIMSLSDEAESDSESDGQATELRSISVGGGIKAASFLFEDDHHCHYKSAIAATTEEIVPEIVVQEICPTDAPFLGLRTVPRDTVSYGALDCEELDKTLSGHVGGSDTEIDLYALSIGLRNEGDPERAIQFLNEVYGEVDESPVDIAKHAFKGGSKRWLRFRRFWSLRRVKRVFSLRRSKSEGQPRVRYTDIIQFPKVCSLDRSEDIIGVQKMGK